jgi:hypothetical protein
MINQTNRYNAANAIVHNTHYLHSHNAEHKPTRVFAATPQNLHQLYDTDSGDYMVLGDSRQVKFGAWYCEGFPHALAIQKANGDGQITLSNAQNLPVVMCDNFNLKTVVSEKHADGCDHIRIVAEESNRNDSYNALQAAYAIHAKHYYLFNPQTLIFFKCTVPTNYIEYLVALIEYAPKHELHKLALRLTFALTALIPNKYTATSAVEFIKNVMLGCGVDFKDAAQKIINKSLARRNAFIEKLNRITDSNGYVRHNCDGLSNEDILALIKQEAANTICNMGTAFVDTRKMGAGKTNLMALRIQQLSACAYISHRVGLINDACKRLGLVSYQEGDRYADKIAVCINSLMQFASSVEGKPLFIDEARQVYDTLLHSSTIDNRKPLLELFGQILRAAPFVHIADAGMNDDALEFYKRHCGNKLVHVIETSTVKSTVNHWQLDGLDACRHSILRDINGGLKGMVGCTSECEAQKTRKFLIKSGIKAKRILIVTGSNKGNKDVADFLADVNSIGQKYDVIIYTSVLGSGVSVEIPAFEFTYLLCSNVLTSNESMQMLARNRCAKDVYVAFGNQLNMNRVTDVELLREGQIEKLRNFAENEGFGWAVNVKAAIFFHEIDDMMHTTRAKMNQDLNDFANHFLLLAEIEGRQFVKIADKTDKIKKLSEEVKEELMQEIQSAPVIDDHEYHALKKLNATTSEQTASIKRYEVMQMTGLVNSQTVPPTIDDIKNYLNGYTSILANFELLSTNSQKLKDIDLLNYKHRNKTKSLLSRQKIFKAFLKPLLKAQIKGGITHPNLMKAVAVLKEHAPELSAEFGNYTDINPIRVASIIRNFAKKFGYDLKNVGRESTGKRYRVYEIKPMADIERYASNRKGLAG